MCPYKMRFIQLGPSIVQGLPTNEDSRNKVIFLIKGSKISNWHFKPSSNVIKQESSLIFPFQNLLN